MPRDGAIIFADLIGKLVILKNLTHRPTLIASDPQQIRNRSATLLHSRRGPSAGSCGPHCDLIEGVESVNAECDPTYPELDRKMACPTHHPPVPQVGHKFRPDFPIQPSASGSVPLMP